MATAPGAVVDSRRSSKLVVASSRRSAAFLFFAVVVVGALVSARWITTITATAQRIGKQASNFIQEEVDMDHVYDYMLHLLTEYAKLLRFKPTKPLEAVEVCPESLACQAEGIEKKFLLESMVKSAHDAGPCDLPPPFNPQELTALKRKKQNSIRQVQTWERRASRT